MSQDQAGAYQVLVGVALRRPPTVQQWRRVIVSAANETEARLVAAQISACTSLMPVVSLIDREGGIA